MASSSTPPARAPSSSPSAGKFLVGEPLFERGPQVSLARGRVRVPVGGIALAGSIAAAARPIADLGRADVPRDVVEALLRDRGLRPTFRGAPEDEARRAIERLEARPGGAPRPDRRPTFTVDPATARDFDDAVSARREGDGIRLWIHIADVAAHVARRAASTARPGAAPTPPTCRGRSSRCCRSR